VVVGPNEALYARRLVADEFNWVMTPPGEEPLAVRSKIRYTMTAVPARLVSRGEGRVEVEFEEPQRAITPGQSVVCYLGEEVVGGGVIREAFA
jgi:tRNA-specific 2-thiouridylase